MAASSDRVCESTDVDAIVNFDAPVVAESDPDVASLMGDCGTGFGFAKGSLGPLPGGGAKDDGGVAVFGAALPEIGFPSTSMAGAGPD